MSAAISDAAFDLIVTEEASNVAYYAKHYTHFEWPAGASGPTVGIGYDCGYVTVAEAQADWAGIVDRPAMNVIVAACGLKGGAAAVFVRAHGQSVTIGWSEAIAEFCDREMPKWISRVQAALPNTDKLAPDSLGAIVSLSYNRGCSYDLPGPRYAEMRSIKAHMAALSFAEIPADILSMQRLWPKGGDLWNRRAHEAALFEHGLAA